MTLGLLRMVLRLYKVYGARSYEFLKALFYISKLQMAPLRNLARTLYVYGI